MDVDECSICLEPLTRTDVETLMCGHKFHNYCIDKLIKKKLRKCPLCNKDIVSPEFDDESGRLETVQRDPSPPGGGKRKTRNKKQKRKRRKTRRYTKRT